MYNICRMGEKAKIVKTALQKAAHKGHTVSPHATSLKSVSKGIWTPPLHCSPKK